MALRDKTEVGDLLRAAALIKYRLINFLITELQDDIEDLIAEANVGDKVPENQAIVDAVEAWQGQLGAAVSAYDAVIDAVMPALGRFVNAPNINDTNTVLDWFQKFLVDNSESIAERDLTSGTPAFSGEGAGTMAVSRLDINGELIDVGHPGTFRLRCVQDVSQGSVAGREVFLADGLPDGLLYPWLEGAPFIGNSYDYAYGSRGVSADIGPNQPRGVAGGRVSVLSAGQGNILIGGTFPLGFDTDWSIISGTPTRDETADRINGTGSLRTTTNFEIRQDVNPNRLRNSVFYAVSLKAKTINGGSGTVTGTLTVRVQDRDGSTTHHTMTVDLSTLTPNAVSVRDPQIFFIPVDAKDLRVQVQLASIGGTAATPTVVIDDVAIGPATLIDGQLVAIYDGTHLVAENPVGRFRFGDIFTVAVTAPEDGILQEHIFNRVYGRYIRSSDTPSAEWVDPTP